MDWQAALLQPIARIQAIDLDEKPILQYTLTHSLASDYFDINSTTGIVYVIKSLIGNSVDDEQIFDMEVVVSDGQHQARVPLKVKIFLN